jgi:hypothetical protein
MSEYAGRIAVGALVAAVIAVSFAYAFYTYIPASSSVTTSTTVGLSNPSVNATSWFGSGAPPGGCIGYNLSGFSLYKGYRLDVYTTSQSETPGSSSICIHTILQNLDNQSASLPANETLTVTNPLVPGAEYLQSCQAPSYSGSFGPNDTSWNCAAFILNNSNVLVRPGNFTAGWEGFQITIVVRFANSPTVINTGGNFGVVQSSSSTTTRVTTGSAYQCGSPGMFKLLTPIQNSSLYLKVVTDSGSIINFNNLPNNGTIFITHALPAGVNTTASTVRDFCLRLENNDNSTGYMSLVGNESLPAVGSYYLTLIAGYANGPGYSGNIPTITVGPNSTVYVTISVPSGRVTVVNCQAGACSTATSTATLLSG